MLIFTGVFAAVVSASRLVVPVYQASTLLLVRQAASAGSPEGAKELVEKVAVLGQILQTDEVFRAAIDEIGWQRITASTSSDPISSRAQNAASFRDERTAAAPSPEFLSLAIWRLRNLTQVGTEPEAGTIRITVRNTNSSLAAELANAISKALIERQLVLSGKPGILEFFESRKVQSQRMLEQAATRLSAFGGRSNIYAAEEQKQLLLRQLNDAESRFNATTQEISQKTGEKQALTDQLRQLKPVTQSPYVTGLVERFGSPERDAARQGRIAGEDRLNSDSPPLLMVRVYQDAMVELLKLNSQLSGLQGLQVEQKKSVDLIRQSLQVLSQNEAEFNRLKSEVATATFNVDTLTKRSVEEQITTEMEKSKLSSIRVAQAAIAPLTPAFPSLKLFVLGGAVLGGVLSLLTALAVHLLAFRSAPQNQLQPGLNVHKELSSTG